MKRIHTVGVTALCLLAMTSWAAAQGVDASKLHGIVVDEEAASFEGEWKHSVHVSPFVESGYRHDDNNGKGEKTARFTAKLPADGKYRVLLSYTTGGSRATNVPVTIYAANGIQEATVNQRQTPQFGTSALLGEYEFKADEDAVVVVANEGTNGHVIVDAVQFVTADQFKLVEADAKKPVQVAKKPDPKKPADKKQEKPKPKPEPMPVFERVAAKGAAKLTSQQLDTKLTQAVGNMPEVELVDDELFLRRATLDICGRQPTVEEFAAFLADTSETKRADVVEKLLESPDYGRNWGNYWSDVIGSRQQEPQLTYHDYRPFKGWLTEQLNAGRPWDEVVFDMLIARGKVGENPQATFIAFHQADRHKLAGETSRVFLGVKIACAECHDHPFVDMPTETFHGMAAFFVRTKADIPWNESNDIVLKSETKGEHKVPGKKDEMKPTALGGIDGGTEYETGLPDLKRRATLANWIVEPENPFFARAYVNRVWARMMGRGFYEPVDDLGETAEEPLLPALHDELAMHFVATQYDHRDLVRLIANTQAYQRSIVRPEDAKEVPFAAAKAKKLRGDEVFDSIVTAIAIPNIRGEKMKPTKEIRFPIPPKSTRDLVNEAFGYDPSFKDELLIRNMKQAMFMMNNEQLQQQINASPDSGTYLSKLLAGESDNTAALTKLYHAVLARNPKDNELKIVLAHVDGIDDRGAAFEDVLWSLLNSAEFTTRR